MRGLAPRPTSSLPSPAPDDYFKRAGQARRRFAALLSYLVRWIAEGVINTLRIGSKTKADGRTFEALLDAISTFLDNSTLSLSHM